MSPPVLILFRIIDRIAEEISPRTAAVLINSPNNPTGVVYSQEFLDRLGEMLGVRSREVGRTVYLISDEPYRKIVYGETMPGSVFAAYPHSIIATSYSKDLSIPGERIGWLAIHPEAEDHDRTGQRLGFMQPHSGLCQRPGNHAAGCRGSPGSNRGYRNSTAASGTPCAIF